MEEICNMEEAYVQDLFDQWLNKPIVDDYGDHGTLLENIESSCVAVVKKAFFDGFSKGYAEKIKHSYEEQMQK